MYRNRSQVYSNIFLLHKTIKTPFARISNVLCTYNLFNYHSKSTFEYLNKIKLNYQQNCLIQCYLIK